MTAPKIPATPAKAEELAKKAVGDYLTAYYGSDQDTPLDDPLHTVGSPDFHVDSFLAMYSLKTD